MKREIKQKVFRNRKIKRKTLKKNVATTLNLNLIHDNHFFHFL
jgi:hypothetical protein